MSSDMTTTAERYSRFLRLCWLGALLHDMGKLGIRFILSKERNSPVQDIHGQIIFTDTDKVSETLLGILSTPFDKICEVPPGFEHFSLLCFICSHHGCLRCMGEHRCKSPAMDRHRLTAMLQAADRIDASNPADIHKQSLLEIRGADFFGREYELEPHLFAGYRRRILLHLEKILSDDDGTGPGKTALIEKVLGHFLSRGLSETRKWAHDIDIFSHSRSVAVYLRIMLLHEILRDGEEENGQVSFKALKVFCDSREARDDLIRTIQYEQCLGAAVYSTFTGVLFFVAPSLGRKELEALIHHPFELSDTCEAGHTIESSGDIFFPRLPEERHMVMLNMGECLRFLTACAVRKPEDSAPGYSMESLLKDMAMVLDYPDFCELDALMEKKRSLSIHLGNLHKAFRDTSETQGKEAYESAVRRMAFLEEQIGKLPLLAVFQERWGWKSRSDAAKAIWDFFSLVLSPIRPPSPLALACRWRKSHLEGLPLENLARAVIMQKHMNLSRFFVLKKTAGEIFRRLEAGGDRETADLALRQQSPPLREAFERGPDRELSSYFIFT